MVSHMSERPDAHRVLVVDAEPNIDDVVAMALRFQGFTVETAHTGQAALGAVTSFKPDLIVLDVMLPDIDGFEVANRLGGPRGRVPAVDGLHGEALEAQGHRDDVGDVRLVVDDEHAAGVFGGGH